MKTLTNAISTAQAIKEYLLRVEDNRSKKTEQTYRYALQNYCAVLADKRLDVEVLPCNQIPLQSITWFSKSLKYYSPATEQLYLTATKGFFDYLVAEELADINLTRVSSLIKRNSRRPGKRLPQFPRTAIESLITYAMGLSSIQSESDQDYLRNMRDRAFLILLGDSGLRVHEACSLYRRDIDWEEYRAIIIGKGNQEAVVRFSRRIITTLRDYLRARASRDGDTGRPLASLPLFARHDRGAGKKIKSISTATGRNIVKQRVREALGLEAVGTITPHSFRHYFVTSVLRGSGGNLKLAQDLARHKNISVTQRYAHLSDDELDKGYHQIFDD